MFEKHNHSQPGPRDRSKSKSKAAAETIKVIAAARKSKLLTPSSLGCLSELATVNLCRGCTHGCIYCYAPGYCKYPGKNTICIYANAPNLLKRELTGPVKNSGRVYFSPSTDLFQPVPELLDMAYEVLEMLLDAGRRVAFLTKGAIPQKHLDLLRTYPSQVHAQIGLITLDSKVLATFEPGAAPAEVRLAQATQLAAAGVNTEFRLDPILPGVTDDEETFGPLCAAVAKTGVKMIAASALFLRPKIKKALQDGLRDKELLDRLLAGFPQKAWLQIRTGEGKVIALPVETRWQIYERLMVEAHRHGIEVVKCGCKNPDLSNNNCNIAGQAEMGVKTCSKCSECSKQSLIQLK